jgi:hypothetical protein
MAVDQLLIDLPYFIGITSHSDSLLHLDFDQIFFGAVDDSSDAIAVVTHFEFKGVLLECENCVVHVSILLLLEETSPDLHGASEEGMEYFGDLHLGIKGLIVLEVVLHKGHVILQLVCSDQKSLRQLVILLSFLHLHINILGKQVDDSDFLIHLEQLAHHSLYFLVLPLQLILYFSRSVF